MVFDSKQMASKFLDGDLNSKKDLDQMVACKKTKEIFSRYQMVSHVIKQEAVAPDVCIADSVMSALANEATVLAPAQAPKPEHKPAEETQDNVISMPARFGKQIGGMAIAASVALVALLNFGSNNSAEVNTPMQAFAGIETPAVQIDRAQLQQAQRVFTDLSQGGQVLPVIQTVSNQKAVAITVTPQQEAFDKEQEKKINPEKK